MGQRYVTNRKLAIDLKSLYVIVQNFLHIMLQSSCIILVKVILNIHIIHCLSWLFNTEGALRALYNLSMVPTHYIDFTTELLYMYIYIYVYIYISIHDRNSIDES